MIDRISATQEDVVFLAAMLDLVPKGHATVGEYERLGRLAEPYLAARFERGDAEVRVLAEEDDHAVT